MGRGTDKVRQVELTRKYVTNSGREINSVLHIIPIDFKIYLLN